VKEWFPLLDSISDVEGSYSDIRGLLSYIRHILKQLN
jgi:hypothetical protein